jgi:hypothetical protein
MIDYLSCVFGYSVLEIKQFQPLKRLAAAGIDGIQAINNIQFSTKMMRTPKNTDEEAINGDER